MGSTTLFAAAALMAAWLSRPVQAGVMSVARVLPSHVRMLSVAEESEKLTLSVSLQLQNLTLLEGRLKAVSTPGSSEYGKYLDADEVAALFPPSPESRAAVLKWLNETEGVEAIVDMGTYINFATTVATANRMLEAEFAHYDVAGIDKVRTTRYSVPDELEAHVALVSPTTYFGRTVAHGPIHVPAPLVEEAERERIESRQAGNQPANCQRLITPVCMEQLYGYGNYTADPASGSRVGFGSFLNQSARLADLRLYQAAFNLPQMNFTSVLINGGLDHQDPRGGVGEANLDLQFMSAVVKTLPVTQFITGGSPPYVPSINLPAGRNTNEPYLEYYQHLMTMKNSEIPQVISNSYGEDEQTVPQDYAVRVCQLIGMMGLRGITVLESSGDVGVGADCVSNDGKETAKFMPQFPSSCPYITSVGGTQAYRPEIAWGASSGGFSEYFPQPWYQKEAIAAYLESGLSSEMKTYLTPYVNWEGRAMPDISAHSLSPPYQFYSSGTTGFTGGTSAASPVVGGIIGLINDARLRAGKPTMGFINPWLYARGYKALTDITGGSAWGCTGTNLQTGRRLAGAAVIPYASFNGTTGWDAATGWGVPNFTAMLEDAMSFV